MATNHDTIEYGLLELFGNDLWIERCSDLSQIIKHIESTEADIAQRANWLRFFKFLEAECSGVQFDSDKQWSQLLNLMEISKKLNHRRFRVRDVIFNKLIIESNSSKIRQLNKAAKVARTVASSLGVLKSLIQMCQLKLMRKDEPDDNQIFEEISVARHYLLDKCQPLVRTLRLELTTSDLQITSNSNYELWHSEVEKHSEIIQKLDEFLNLLHTFQSELLHLKPLMNVDQSASNSRLKLLDDDQQQQRRPNTSLDNCKIKFIAIREFHSKLMSSLHNLALSGYSATMRVSLVRQNDGLAHLSLVRLFNSRNELIQPDLYGSGLTNAVLALKEIRQTIDDIMQNLRAEFGRFYFVNDLELLTIIALNTRLITEEVLHSEINNQHLISKLFNNSICRFHIDRDKHQVVAVESPLGEIIQFSGEERILLKKKLIVYSVEIVRILNETIRKLRRVLATLLFKSLEDEKAYDLIDWSLPVQLMNLAEQVKFCQKVEQSLQADGGTALDKLMEFYKDRLRRLSRSDDLFDKCADKLGELKKSATLSLSVHFISALTMLKSNLVDDKTNWHWLKQVRFYLVDDGCKKIEVHIADAKFEYRFDYLPLQITDNSDRVGKRNRTTFKRLISTQLSERCFLVASQAVRNFRLGANPFGPAGSGKTETIKALGHLLGCQVIVHNCDESNDSDSIDRLIWGLAHTGLWGCFDEFNRLSFATLSSVSGTLELVQTCIREGRTNVELSSGDLMCVDPNSAFFITLNPGNHTTYRGRRQLPANLRNLFLPISMTRVQISSIVAETLLDLSTELSQNENQLNNLIDESAELAHKLSNWLDFVRVTLQTNRCEWDLRQVMAILKRLTMLVIDDSDCSRQLEHHMIESILVEVVPRLSREELPILKESLGRYFNGEGSKTETIDTNLTNKLRGSCNQLSDEEWKIVERQIVSLRNQLQTRTGVMLLGATNSGKSRTWKLLQLANGKSVKWMALNPRSCRKADLFGYVDKSTKKWIDGLFTKMVRIGLCLLQNETDLRQVWIILDGPVDPDWIESLNSVLDDNQTLTLSSGERLDFQLSPNQSIRLIFETSDISFASPATISRLGLVYFEDPSPISVKLNDRGQTNHESSINRLLEKDSCNLLILTGADPKYRLMYVRELLGEQAFSTYTCNKLSNCSHLEEILEARFGHDIDSKQHYLVLNNIDSIEVEDKWQVKSFIEYLRYIVTYAKCSMPSANFKRMRKTKFVLLMNSVDGLDKRMQSLANIIQVDSYKLGLSDEATLSNKQLEYDTLDAFLEESKIFPESLVCEIANLDVDSVVELKICSTYGNWRICRFSNSRLVEESITTLEDVLGAGRYKEKDRNEQVLFMLRSREIRLIHPGAKSRLYHRLNWLNSSLAACNRFRFFYMSNSNLSNEDDSIFWRSISDRQYLDDQVEEATIHNKLSKLKNSTEQPTETELLWLSSKVTDYLAKHHEINRHQINACLTTLMSLIYQSRSEFESRKSRLLLGSRRLEEFEQSVEQVRESCRIKKEQLQAKKDEMAQLMSDIDLALKNSQEQRIQSNDLKHRQIAKKNDIYEKSERIKEELSIVSQSIESSKAEIRQHLKPEALNEIKALRSPPETVKDILDALLILLVGPDADRSWLSIKSYLTRYSLKDELTNYNFEKNINANLLSKVSKQMRTRPASFDSKQAGRASRAIVPILGWIKATLDYGKVLLITQPLSEEMQLLSSELARLSLESEKVERHLAEIDQEIQRNTSKLTNLRLEYDVAQKQSENVELLLDKAQKVRSEVEGQSNKWQTELVMIESMLNEKQGTLIKLCLAASFESILTRGEIQCDLLHKLLQSFDLTNLTEADYVRETMRILTGEQVVFKQEETGHLLQLIALKICLEFQSLIVPFVTIGSNDSLQEEELRQFLSFKSILCCEKDIFSIRCDNTRESIHSIELAQSLNKLVVIDVCGNNDLDLDIMDIIGAGKVSKSRIILVGQLDKHANIGHLLRPMRLWIGQNSSAQTNFDIMNHLIARYDPQLSESWDIFEKELRDKQAAFKQLEANLLCKLTGIGESGSGSERPLTTSSVSLHEEVVEILNDVHLSSNQLASDMRELETKMNVLQAQQNRYADFARKAAEFYNKLLAKFGERDKFYRIPLHRYMELLLLPSTATTTTTPNLAIDHIENRAESDVNDLQLPDIDYKRILATAMLSMQPKDRLHFYEQAKLQQVVEWNSSIIDDNNRATNLGKASSSSDGSQLRQAILGLFEDEINARKSNKPRSAAGFSKLMVILHNSAKSSPQFEIDELLNAQKQDANSQFRCVYSKIYATGDQQWCVLEQAFARLISRSFMSHEQAQDKQVVRCLCIANAHLSANSLNANLLRMLRQVDQAMRVIVILVGESSQATSDSPLCEFDSLVLNFAQVKYWHDELGLDLAQRFQLLESTCCLTIEPQSSDLFNRARSSAIAANSGGWMQFARQLILFHVVCQELVRLSASECVMNGSEHITTWKVSYTFDYDQLQLALKSASRWLAKFESGKAAKFGNRARSAVCHHLNSIIYGARLETAEDELVLDKLIHRFLGSAETSEQQLAKFESYLRNGPDANKSRSLASELVGHL